MSPTEPDVLEHRERSNWVRLHTLVVLRWIAIVGQSLAILTAVQVYDFQFEVGMTAMAVGASIVANLFSTFLYPENKRLSEREAFLMLLFDLLQLGLLLYLTGGLNNPFALLVLAPVTISATFLRLNSTVIIGIVAIVIVTTLARFHLPLSSSFGTTLELPKLFLFGFWLSLMTGIIFLGLYARQITAEMHNMSDALFATQMALAREQKLTDLGGVVAAAAHELGTPLATIKLVSSELLDEVEDNEAFRDDVLLIKEQADRCRDILRSMGRAGKDDLHIRRVPIEALVKEAAEPHISRGKLIEFSVSPETDHPKHQPVVERRPEVLHGLRNLIQNAVDFAESKVEVEMDWNETIITLRIADNGAGFPASVIGRIGNPFMSRRRQSEDRKMRPGYEGMGLGLFIAKTLLERSGARLSFSNGGGFALGEATGGAIVTVEWPRDRLDPPGNRYDALGENQPFQV